MDTKELREEYANLHKSVEQIITVAAADKRDFTADEKEKQEKMFSRLQAINEQLSAEKKLAEFKFDANDVQKPTQHPGQNALEQAEQFARGQMAKIDRKEFGKHFTQWSRNGDAGKFATITGATQSGIMLPIEVVEPLVPTRLNTLREAHQLLGVEVFKTPTTAKVNLPVASATAGGVVAENASSETENEPGFTGSISLPVSTYQSGSVWFSNQELSAVDFDLFSAIYPAMVYSKELGLESAAMAAIIADTNITQTVATSTVSGFTYANLVGLNRAFPKRYDTLKAIVLSQAAYTAAENLTTTTGYPILNALDPQNSSMKYFNGTPVLRSDYLQSFGANHVVGVAISLVGFRLRDCDGQNIARYVQYPGRPNQTGFNLFAYHSYGYDPAAMATLVCPAS
jgi:HK97 family phage major capsid protein